MGLTEKLNLLTLEQERELFDAFNEGKSHVLYFNETEFIGVHIPEDTHLQIILREGYWVYGKDNRVHG